MKHLLRVFGYIRHYPWMAVAMLLCAAGSTLLVIVFPAVTQRVIDDAIRGGRPDLLAPLCLIGLGSFVLQNGLTSLRILVNNVFEQRVIFDLRSDLYAHLQRLPLNWFDNRATGDVMTRVIEDVSAMERVLIDGIETGLIAVLQIVSVLWMLFYYRPSLAWAALLPIPFLAAGALLYTTTAHKRYKASRKAASAMNSILHDNLAGIRQIKTYVREEAEHARFNEVSDGLRRATLWVMKVWAGYSPAMDFFTNCGLVLVVFLGGRAVLAGEMQIGELVAFIALVKFLYDPIGKLHTLNQMFQAGRAAAARVFEIMDEPVEPGLVESGKSKVESPKAIGGDIEFKDVSFSYAGRTNVLQHVSLHARPGETIALVGTTGAGKSTLVNLLTRFYEFDQGDITIDDVSLRDLPQARLRGAIGLVTQESFLFNGTVRENLRFAKPDATDEELLEAAGAAGARQFIEHLPEGLSTRVGERGVKLSVGEKQRVSIARVLLKDPPILILDEATASVDNETERLIQAALDRLMSHRTCFVIAHRLSTVRNADQILVLEKGRIVERGRHAELLLRGGKYAQLYAASQQREEEELRTAEAETTSEAVAA
jgi:ATP-binding cassette subfamily B protein